MLTVRQRPCPTCPYRRDVPSGIWDASEYDKLPRYDLDTTGQLAAGVFAVFRCHSRQERICAGWAGCHDMSQSLAVRLNWRDIDPAILDYVSPVPLFASGAEAAEHGKRDISSPGADAALKIAQLLRSRETRSGNDA